MSQTVSMEDPIQGKVSETFDALRFKAFENRVREGCTGFTLSLSQKDGKQKYGHPLPRVNAIVLFPFSSQPRLNLLTRPPRARVVGLSLG